MLHVNDISRFISHGKTNYGRLVRYYRKEIMHWTNATILAELLNEFLGDEEVSERWVQRMEKDNKVPTDDKRRWIIATLLNIPPAYLGLTVTKSLLPPYDDIKLPIPTKTSSIDFDEYYRALKGLWALPYQSLDDVLIRIYQLEHASVVGPSAQKDQSGRLLCEYLMAGANMLRAQGYLDSAIGYLNDALAILKEKIYLDLEGKAYYLRSYCNYEKWRISDNKQLCENYMLQSLVDSHLSVYCLEQANKNRLFVSPSLAGAAYQQKGKIFTHNVQDEADRTHSLAVLDQGGTIITNNEQKDPYFFDITPDWYHLGKAQAYIALGWSNSALKDLQYLTGDPHQKRRFLTANIAEAEAYAASGQIEMAVAYAEASLEVSREIHAYLHIARIASLYQSLRQHENFMGSTDVARLGVKLLEVQHPELFT